MSGAFAFARSWGAELQGDGRVRLRLWAPAQKAVFVVSAQERLPLARQEDGWFELITDQIAVGSGYQFELANGMRVPDPAARAQVGDVHGPSLLVDPKAYRWRTAHWRGRPWHEAVIYELHPGTFSECGTFAGIEAKLDHLAGLGITAIELMPVAQFGGQRGWGYDGVLLYAPHIAYGGPDALKSLIDSAHSRGLMVLLDVVYNHFGPEGNYLHAYAPNFFDTAHHTPWGPAIDYSQPPVRQFLIENALYWLEEFRFDGLRLDAIDHMHDTSSPHILEELAETVRSRITDRHIHLTTEDGRNITALHGRDAVGRPLLYTAEWNDDWHHVAHVLAAGEADGYYTDYGAEPRVKLAKALAAGYIYQGEASPYFGVAARGEPSAHLPPVAFIDFLQNHDQIGNRAFGERLESLDSRKAIEALTAILLLSPHIPLLFMGEEWAETRPFTFFTDFQGMLGNAVREGRRNEFRRWRTFQDPHYREKIPDPNAPETFESAKLDWTTPEREHGKQRLALVTRLLDIRKRELMPRLEGVGGNSAVIEMADENGIHLAWRLGDGSEWALTANLSDDAWDVPPTMRASATAGRRVLFDLPGDAAQALTEGRLPPWSVIIGIAEPAHG
jgi:maltooligosyltrehalose trehalohydrolase